MHLAKEEFTQIIREMPAQANRFTRSLQSETGTLAGAHLDMASAIRTAVALAGISLEDALRSASLTPARYLGVDAQRGTLRAGSAADIVAMTSALEIVRVWKAGEV